MKRTGKPTPHTVEPNPGGWFDVKSGRSGNVYRVVPFGGDAAVCNCEFGKHADGKRECSHIAAVREYAANALQTPEVKSGLDVTDPNSPFFRIHE